MIEHEERVFNFNPGPGVLPESVLEKVQEELLNYRKSGASILELSHRSDVFLEVLEDAKARLRRLTNLSDDYQILFMAGGAQMQFSAVPMNLIKRRAAGRGLYAVTGKWGELALKEGKKYGNAETWVTSKPEGYRTIPKIDEQALEKLAGASYVHLTSNNTLFGTQWQEFPATKDVPLIVDATSDFLSKRVDFSQFGVVYASLQKNLGPAGLTLVIVRGDLVGSQIPETPNLLSYESILQKDSLNNTINVFAVYVLRYVLEWYEELGGVDILEKENRAKAEKVYSVLDRSALYETYAEKADRSLNNIVFHIKDEGCQRDFLDRANRQGLIGLKGHREVGGVRVSLYNAMPAQGVEALVGYLLDFEKKI
jgi:phosphoserine aminotransferase